MRRSLYSTFAGVSVVAALVTLGGAALLYPTRVPRRNRAASPRYFVSLQDHLIHRIVNLIGAFEVTNTLRNIRLDVPVDPRRFHITGKSAATTGIHCASSRPRARLPGRTAWG